jgi:hypothetical protein
LFLSRLGALSSQPLWRPFCSDHFGIVSRPQSIATGSDRSIALRIVDYLLQKTKSVTWKKF